MIKAIFFDLDDTLISFDGISFQAWQEVCSQADYVNTVLLLDTIHSVSHEFWSDPERHRIGRLKLDQTRIMLVKEAFNRLGLENLIEAERLALNYTRLRESLMHLFPGSIETLKRFRAENYPLALITNGESIKQRAKISRFGLESYFDLVIIEEEFGTGKPDGKVYEHALNTFGIMPQEACMVGDNLEWDVFAPQKLGITGVWNNYRKIEQLDEGVTQVPNFTITGISEFYPLFQEKIAFTFQK